MGSRLQQRDDRCEESRSARAAGVIGVIGLAVALVAAFVLAGTRRRPSVIGFPEG